MYVKTTEADQVRKDPRKYKSRFSATEEWTQMKADLDAGVAPGEELTVGLSDADREKYNIMNRRTPARFIQKYIDEKSLPYVVKTFRKGTLDCVQVRHKDAPKTVKGKTEKAS